jgi:hypothetical protein
VEIKQNSPQRRKDKLLTTKLSGNPHLINARARFDEQSDGFKERKKAIYQRGSLDNLGKERNLISQLQTKPSAAAASVRFMTRQRRSIRS